MEEMFQTTNQNKMLQRTCLVRWELLLSFGLGFLATWRSTDLKNSMGCCFHQQIIEHLQETIDLPSGKHTKNYGTSPFSMGKSTINGHVQ
jgi:hypothetical protein